MREDPNVLQCMKMENSLLEVTPIGSPIRKYYLHPIGSRAPTVFAHLFFCVNQALREPRRTVCVPLAQRCRGLSRDRAEIMRRTLETALWESN